MYQFNVFGTMKAPYPRTIVQNRSNEIIEHITFMYKIKDIKSNPFIPFVRQLFFEYVQLILYSGTWFLIEYKI